MPSVLPVRVISLDGTREVNQKNPSVNARRTTTQTAAVTQPKTRKSALGGRARSRARPVPGTASRLDPTAAIAWSTFATQYSTNSGDAVTKPLQPEVRKR